MKRPAEGEEASSHPQATEAMQMTIVIPTKSKRGWTQNEEMALKDAVDSRGGHHHATTEEFSWGQVAALVPGMSTKQCKDKWVNSLRLGLSFG